MLDGVSADTFSASVPGISLPGKAPIPPGRSGPDVPAGNIGIAEADQVAPTIAQLLRIGATT
jgi:hypothetical protein